MSVHSIASASLVLYKQSPAKVVGIADKVEIELEGGKRKRVRFKDIALLHPGPVTTLPPAEPAGGELEEAWELLAEERCDLEELAGLIYGEFTPTTAWASWQRVAEGLYFEGDSERISARSRTQIEADIAAREAKERAEREEREFYQRLQQGQLEAVDHLRLREVEQLALGQSTRSRILATLGHAETEVNAHRTLVEVGYWPTTVNPWPGRLALPLADPDAALPQLADEARTDLTHLQSFAIDDAGSMDPDDAISLDGDRIWVHVADVAALVPPDSAIDIEARARAANLYLPERIVHMLPAALTPALALGLTQRSPALSFGFRLSERAEPVDLQVIPSWISVRRSTYREANEAIGREPLATLKRLAERYQARRRAQGAINLDLPEASIKVSADGEIAIRPLENLQSRALVTELMLMTGEVVAGYALANDIPIPFASQPPADATAPGEDMAARYAFRRLMKPSLARTLEEPHAGLGLARYTRVTSPLRRYLDLVVHQQLRRHLRGQELLSSAAVSERIDLSAPAAGSVRRAERHSNLHWKLLYLQSRPQWRGEGIVVERQEQRVTLIIPDLAMEVRMRYSGPAEPNARLQLAVREIDVPDQLARFRVLS
ncbi:MAG: RNB domain-containing ribonuclease [Gammaproteobacteria bacterium]|nr:RNB domain-containing ribonuclease [Gammaproteobacteria bacterium]